MLKRICTMITAFVLVFTTLLQVPVQAAKPDKYIWKESAAPNYVAKISKAKVSNKPKKGKIKYSKLDSLGRTRRVVGNINYKLVKDSAGWRETIPETEDPSGWPEQNQIIQIRLYNGRTYKGYGMNRSHLIADSLGGKAIRRNLITGTRMQNVGANDGKGGMAYTERRAVNWLYKHKKGSVYYSATPVYKGKELIPRSVVVDMKTSDGRINERVIVYNYAKGYKVDYYSGVLTAIEEEKDNGNGSDVPAETTYIVNTNTKKFHLPTCPSVNQMKDKNKKTYNNVDISTLKRYGYKPCQNCLKGK